MDKASQKRWAVWLIVLTATVIAIFYPVENSQLAEVAAPASAEDVVAASAIPTITPPQPSSATVNTAPVVVAGMPALESNPFAPRNWQPVPLPVVAAPAPIAPAPIVPAEAAGPPPLPFKFMGRMNDGGEQVVYLSQGEQTLIAKIGETVGTGYKVLGMDAQRIEFEYLPTGDKQTLALPASE